MYRFDYHKASDAADAVRRLEGAEDGQYLAGGMTLLPTLKMRLAAPSDLVDLAGISELSGIEADDGAIHIGAMTRHADVAASDLVRENIPALAALAGGIGDPAVRNRGTLGGSVATADPAADYPAALLGLGATIITERGRHPADGFFSDLFETALAEGELITGVCFPMPEQAAYMKFKNPASRYAIVGVFVARFKDGVRVAVTGAGSSVFRVAEMEAALAENFSADAISGMTISAEGLNSDLHAGADYRAHLTAVMARRAVEAANG